MVKSLFKFLFPTTFAAVRDEGYRAAIQDILVFKKKIYTGTVVLPGRQKTISNCTFLGDKVGLKITGRQALSARARQAVSTRAN